MCFDCCRKLPIDNLDDFCDKCRIRERDSVSKSCEKCNRVLGVHETKCRFCSNKQDNSLCNKCGKRVVIGNQWWCEPCLERYYKNNPTGKEPGH